MNKIKNLLVVLALAGAGVATLTAANATQPTLGASMATAYNPNSPSSFYFNYMNDPNQVHYWVQSPGDLWTEHFPNGDTRTFHTMYRAICDNNTGTVILSDDGAQLQLFIPDKNAIGENPTWIRQRTGLGPWTWFQQMLGAD